MNHTISAVQYIRSQVPSFTPKIGVVLGSGLGDFGNQLENATTLPYSEIHSFPKCSAAGHRGALLLGSIEGVPIACMQGRAHYYEGNAHSAITIPIRTLKQLGCEILILTNAAASLRTEVQPGSLVIINDHINFTGQNPLVGLNDDSIGPRFPSLQNAYDAELIDIALSEAAKLAINVSTGVYCAVLGPSYETPAEIRAFKILGADLVGMSTVAETIVARHCGMKVLAISTVTNMASGMSDEYLTHEGVLKVAKMAADDLTKLLRNTIRKIHK